MKRSAETQRQITRLRVQVAELKRDAAVREQLVSELLCERASLRRDCAEWERIAAVRAQRIVLLEQAATAAC